MPPSRLPTPETRLPPAVDPPPPLPPAKPPPSNLPSEPKTFLTVELTNSAMIDRARFDSAFCTVVVPRMIPVIEVSSARWTGCNRLAHCFSLSCTAWASSFCLSVKYF